MTRRPRIARLLTRLAVWLVEPSVLRWEPFTQERLDALIASSVVEDR